MGDKSAPDAELDEALREVEVDSISAITKPDKLVERTKRSEINKES